MDLKLRECRKKAGFTAKQVAERMGVSVDSYRKWESGYTMIRLEDAYRCADMFGCSIDALAGRQPRKSKAERQIEYAMIGLNEAGHRAVADYAELAFLKADYRR